MVADLDPHKFELLNLDLDQGVKLHFNCKKIYLNFNICKNALFALKNYVPKIGTYPNNQCG